MENISKAEFDEIGANYPKAYEHFLKWVDSYKSLVNWNEIFRDEEDYTGESGNAIKFHELPFEMQFGIIAKFMIEVYQDEHLLLQLEKQAMYNRLGQTLCRLEKRFKILERKQEQEMKYANVQKNLIR